MSVEVRNLSYTYEINTFRIQALNDVSFKIESGELVGIMGQTGCGKSTLAQLIAGLLKPCEGKIFVDNMDINDARYNRLLLRKTVGMVFQYPENQLFESSVEKDVAFGLKYSGMSKDMVNARVRWALEMVGFDYDVIREKSPFALSNGEKRRVAIAGIIVLQPKILILDEPVAGLDSYSRKQFFELIMELNRQGTSIIMISHNIDYMCEYMQRIIVLNEGKLVCDKKVEELYELVNVENTRNNVLNNELIAGDRRIPELNNISHVKNERMKSVQDIEQYIGKSSVRNIAECLQENDILERKNIIKYDDLIRELKVVLGNGLSNNGELC